MSFTFTAATLTTRDDRRRRPALTLGQIARTLLLLLACAAALGLMTRHGEAAEGRVAHGGGRDIAAPFASRATPPSRRSDASEADDRSGPHGLRTPPVTRPT